MRTFLFRGQLGEAQDKSALQKAVDSDNHDGYNILYHPQNSSWIDRAFATRLLSSAAANADPQIVSDMLRLGVNPNGEEGSRFPSDPPHFEAANGIMSNDQAHSATYRRAIVRQLLAEGVNFEHCHNGYCDSVLGQVSDAGIARLLLDAAANPDFKVDEGEHVLYKISDEDVGLACVWVRS